MKMDYVIGIDGGATKSQIAVFDTEGGFIGLHNWGPLNHESLHGGFRQLYEELGAFIYTSLKAHRISNKSIKYGVFGMAGNDNSHQYQVISEIIREIGVESFSLYNDAFLGIPAGSPEVAGICAINGTGCTLAAIDYEGNHMQIGGIGDLSRDLGGGYYMGMRAVGAAYSALCRKGEPTLLTEYIMETLRIKDSRDFLNAVSIATGEESFKLGDIGKLTFKAAEDGDDLAMKLLEEVAENYAGGIAHMIETMAFPSEKTIIVTLAGSVFTKEKSLLLKKALYRKVNSYNLDRKVDYTTLSVPPVAGAVILALYQGVGLIAREKVCSQFQL